MLVIEYNFCIQRVYAIVYFHFFDDFFFFFFVLIPLFSVSRLWLCILQYCACFYVCLGFYVWKSFAKVLNYCAYIFQAWIDREEKGEREEWWRTNSSQINRSFTYVLYINIQTREKYRSFIRFNSTPRTLVYACMQACRHDGYKIGAPVSSNKHRQSECWFGFGSIVVALWNELYVQACMQNRVTEWEILKCTSEKWAGVWRNYRGETSETAKNIAQWVLVVATAQNATAQNSLPSTYIPTFSSHGICVGIREKNPSVRFLLEKQNEYMETAITIQFYYSIIHSIHVAICIHSFDQSICVVCSKGKLKIHETAGTSARVHTILDDGWLFGW